MFVTSMYDDIMSMVKGLIIKREDLANEKETLQSIMAYERYYSFFKGVPFDHIPLDVDILISVLPSNDLVVKAQESRYNIPTEYRTIIYNLHKDRYFTNYIELNDYYRQLYGLPDITDPLKIYVTDIPGVDPLTPIHEMSIEEISILNIKGKLAELKEKYPTRGYLNFLGNNKIHFHTARQTPNFYIFAIGPTVNTKNEHIFRKEYHKTLKFHVAAMYRRDLFSINDTYDGIFGMMILVSAIRNSLSADMYLNFTDDFMDNMLKAYGLYVDFATLPTVYKKRLVLNLDKLISRRKTDIVLVDIAKLFGYSSVVANRFYLVKTHAKDISGNPIFPKLPGGGIDYDAQYDLNFLKVDVTRNYINLESDNTIPYETLVENDPFWEYTNITELKKDEFNIRMSKYMSIEAAYNVTKLNYELSFFINLLLDTREFHQRKYANKYSAMTESTLFTYIVFMLAAAARVIGYDGNIPMAPAYVGQICKFNLSQTKTALQTVIDKYKLKITADEIMLIKPTTEYISTDTIINNYISNTKVYDMIYELRDSAKTYNEYTGYSNLLTMLFTAENMLNIYKLSDGSPAETYWDLLNDLDPSLGFTITSADDSSINGIYLYILESLQEIFSTDVLQFLFINTPDMNDGIVRTHMKNMLEKFKAPAVQIDNIDIYFSIDSTASPVRIFDEILGDRIYPVIDPATIQDTGSFRTVRYLTSTVSVSDDIKTII